MPPTIPPMIARTMKLTRKITTITPKTCQPLPRTSSRLRPKDSSTPARSITITGTITAQMVSRKRPGMIRRTNPIAMPIPARMPTTSSGPMNGAAELNSDPIV